MTTYRVKNWRKFQHYKDRNPPWIKLHWELLSSMDWVILNDASRVLAVACMLVASRNDGEIRGDETGLKYLQRVAHLNAKPDLKPLISCGLLESASEMLATCLQDAIPETYKDSTQKLTEEEEEDRPRKRASALPKDFEPSPELREWAKQHGYADNLDAHLDYFRDYCAANRKLYVDHEAALRNCIKADWGGIRKAKPINGEVQDRWWESESGTVHKGAELGIRARAGESMQDYRGRIREAIKHG